MKKLAFLAAAMALGLAGCFDNDAAVASRNLSTAADNFEINRRIIFYNVWNGEYMLNIEGLCSLGTGSHTNSVTVTCKTGRNEYKKHFLGLTTNVTWFAEQLGAAQVGVYHYRVTFKPQVILPNIDLRVSPNG